MGGGAFCWAGGRGSSVVRAAVGWPWLRRSPGAGGAQGTRANDCGPEPSLRTTLSSSSLSPSAPAFRFPRAHRRRASPVRRPPQATACEVWGAVAFEAGQECAGPPISRPRGRPESALAPVGRRGGAGLRGVKWWDRAAAVGRKKRDPRVPFLSWRALQPVAADRDGVVAQRGHDAVSYTHLRAHET